LELQAKYKNLTAFGCHTYRNEREVSYPLFYVPDDSILSSIQEHSSTCTHPVTKRCKRQQINLKLIQTNASPSSSSSSSIYIYIFHLICNRSTKPSVEKCIPAIYTPTRLGIDHSSFHHEVWQGLLNIHILLLTVQNQDDHEHKLIFHPLYKKNWVFF